MIVTQKYFGTSEYRAVLEKLLAVARVKEPPINYDVVFKLMRLKGGNFAAGEAGHLLGEISERTHLQGEPMLSALVLNKDTRLPGAGFFGLAKSLGRLEHNASPTREKEFWDNEITAIRSTQW